MNCCRGKKSVCERPEKLKGRPEECTPAQMQKCHGTTAKHPCAPKKDGKK